MYKKLLVSNGGGIVSVAQQAKQKNAVTLAIGLGGTGISALRTLKREVYERVRPDNVPDPNAPAAAVDDVFIPRYDHIKYLAVDTDRTSLGEAGDIDFIPETEFLDISHDNIAGLLSKTHVLRAKPQLQWLMDNLQIDTARKGAGGVRQIGRLLLIEKSSKLVDMITSAITKAQGGMTNPAINIHIFAGIAGGTGAGTFMDVCYILQYALKTMALAGKAFTCGYFFLPDVNEANHNTGYLYDNAFAAMKEFDYAMNYGTNKGRWQQQYQGFAVDTAEPPVNLAHLVSCKDEHGDLPLDPYNYVMHVAADYVMEFIVENQGFDLESHIGNFQRLVGIVPKSAGTTYNYCVLGAASTYMPYREILTYLAGKIFEGFAGTENNMPALTDAEALTRTLMLTYDDIEREVDRGSKTFGVPDFDVKVLQENVQNTKAGEVPYMLQLLFEAKEFNVGEREKNIKALLDTRNVPGADAGAAQFAMTAKVKQELIDIAADPAKGPYYAAALLKATSGHDLDNIIAGMITTTKSKRDQAQKDQNLALENWGKALAKFKTAGLLGRRAAAEDYLGVVSWYFQCWNDFQKYSQMLDMFNKWREQIAELSDNFFAVFSGVMTELRNTFKENISWINKNTVAAADYAQPFMSVRDLQTTLDAEVAAMDIPLQLQRFVRALIGRYDVWENGTEERISAAVSDYFGLVLDKYAKRTMQDYLEIKFGTKSITELQQNVYDQIITPLASRSAPRFWTAESDVMAAAKPVGYLSYPDISTPIQNAVQQYVAANVTNNITDRPANVTDRISIFRMLAGVPMFAYQGVENALPAYKHSNIPGRHLYEGSELDPRNNLFLPDITPLSRIAPADYNPEQTAASNDYDEALAVGIIAEESMAGSRSKWYIKGVNAEAITVWKAALEKAAATGTPTSIAASVATAKANLAAGLPGTAEKRDIPNNGAAGYEEKVLKDHVVDSLELMAFMREQLAIVRPFTELLAAAEGKASTAGQLGRDVKAFAEALGAGVIKAANRFTYTYTGDVAGFATEMNLTDIDTQPYGQDIPPYSAFLGFCKLDAGEREHIAQAVKSALVGDAAALQASAEAAKNAVPEAKMGSWILVAQNNHQAEVKNVEQFFQLFNRELNTFIAVNT